MQRMVPPIDARLRVEYRFQSRQQVPAGPQPLAMCRRRPFSRNQTPKPVTGILASRDQRKAGVTRQSKTEIASQTQQVEEAAFQALQRRANQVRRLAKERW